MSGLTAEATRVAVISEGSVFAPCRNAATPLLAAGGVAILLALGGVGVGGLLEGSEVASAPSPPPAAATLERPSTAPVEVVVEMSYAPGESSGWHVHPVNHTVQVLAGALAFYDEACRVRYYGPGETYVGGTQAHMARNEGVIPVQMVVSTSEPAVPADSVTRVTVPAGCPVA
jgi:quercetin dioxygenase-like cupin family protein